MARLELMTQEGIEAGTGASAAEPDTLFELGLMYASGRDVSTDYIEAHKWFNLAALKGNDAAKRYRAELAGEMSKAQIARAQKLAREWLSVH